MNEGVELAELEFDRCPDLLPIDDLSHGLDDSQAVFYASLVVIGEIQYE
jgi:hypothetical protein